MKYALAAENTDMLYLRPAENSRTAISSARNAARHAAGHCRRIRPRESAIALALMRLLNRRASQRIQCCHGACFCLSNLKRATQYGKIAMRFYYGDILLRKFNYRRLGDDVGDRLPTDFNKTRHRRESDGR